MDKFKDKQYEIEENYIFNNYLNNSQVLAPLEQISDSFKKTDVSLNGKPYILYKYNLGNVLLIPAVNNLFSGDFDEIYNIHFDPKYGIHFNITRKKNSIIEMFNYDYHTKESNLVDDYTNVIASYFNMDDSKNILCKVFENENVPLESFILRSGITKVKLEKNQKYVEIRKDETGIKKYTTSNLETMMFDILNDSMNFEDLQVDPNESLIKIAEKVMNEKEFERFKIKIKVSY